MNATRRIVITGMGAVAPIGTGLEAMWQKLSADKTGVGPVQAFTLPPAMPPFAAEVRDFEPKNFVSNRKNLRIMARDIQLAVGAAKMAMDHSAIAGKVDPTRFGVSCGAGLIATELDDLGEGIAHSLDPKGKFDLKLWGKEGMEMVQPLWMLKYLPNMPACHISILHDAQGPNNSITVGEASALTAVGEAYRILARDVADVFLAGGCDTKIHPLSFVRLALLDKLSTWKGDPGEAVRPYDAERTGLVPAEGAGFLLLEEAEHAKSRKAKNAFSSSGSLGTTPGWRSASSATIRADADPPRPRRRR